MTIEETAKEWDRYLMFAKVGQLTKEELAAKKAELWGMY